MMLSVDVAVLGGGPAGISAAATAAQYGASVAVIDDGLAIGGKVFQNHPDRGRGLYSAMEKRFSDRMFQHWNSRATSIRMISPAQVWHIQDRTIYLGLPGQKSADPPSLRAEKIILAEGAMERQIPFPDWTLPGIVSLGGLGILASRGVIPGKRVLVVGSGPLPVSVIRHLARHNVTVLAFASPVSRVTMSRNALTSLFWMGPTRLAAALEFLKYTRSRHIPFYFSHMIQEASGEGRLEKARIVRIGPRGEHLSGTEKTYAADILAVGFGLIPSNSLSRICGCLQDYDHHAGYWKPVRDSFLETSVAGVFVVGDAAGIRGYPAAFLEGRLAGLEACSQLGKLSRHRALSKIRRLQIRLLPHNRMGRLIDAISGYPYSAVGFSVPDHTLVCRCEEVSCGEIRRARENGAVDLHDIKRRTRLGMGRCQGRFCSAAIGSLLPNAPETGVFTPRVPVRPISINTLLDMPTPEETP